MKSASIDMYFEIQTVLDCEIDVFHYIFHLFGLTYTSRRW